MKEFVKKREQSCRVKKRAPNKDKTSRVTRFLMGEKSKASPKAINRTNPKFSLPPKTLKRTFNFSIILMAL
ncbi:MAG: hypothetical protein PVJ97_03140 [Flavobacteriaceae bacterium]